MIPADAAARRAVPPVICYPNETLPDPGLGALDKARAGARKSGECLVPRARGAAFTSPPGISFASPALRGRRWAI